MPSPIHDYLTALHHTRVSRGSVRERGHYAALQNLLNAIGATLKPKVLCVSELANIGAGSPDFGLFTAAQLAFDQDQGVRAVRPPDRGVIEAKAPDEPIERIVESTQVAQYWDRYQLVLVTNFRSFVVVGADEFGRRVTRERFDLAPDEAGFWAMAARPASALTADIVLRFTEFLTRLLLHNASLTQPRDVAIILASLARDCRARLEAAGERDQQRSLLDGHSTATIMARLDDVRETLESALGIRFDRAQGMHFFRSTLVQTLFYGIFSGWVIWARQKGTREQRGPFSPDRVSWLLRLRVIRALFEQVYRPGALEGLGIRDVLDWACDVLRRVDDGAFFSRFREDRAVQYFYEPFLEAYDPELRKQLGVWYTPPEVVDYMVERVDWALRTQLGVARGLADERVHVLDPCCGTGSFFLSVLSRIHRTLIAEGEDALAGSAVKRAAIERVHGFEIMPAPLVVAHLQVALALEHQFRAPLRVGDGHTNRPDEFPSILLTNALTGLDERHAVSPTLPLPELADDGYLAGKVKRDEEIWVVLGNPPYNGFAGVGDTEEERTLTDAWRQVRAVRPPEGQGLADLYARFWRMAERRIAQGTGFGVVCLITNYSWLDGLSFTGMRESFLDRFDDIWIDCLNGDKFKTGKKTPDGKPDPSIFSTKENPEGIGVGTAIGLCVRRPGDGAGPGGYRAAVRFRHLWGKDKREQLAASAVGDGVALYETINPSLPMGLPFVPGEARADYYDWPSLPDLMPVSWPGVKTSRDDFLVDIDRDRLVARIRDYFDPAIGDAEIAARYPGVMSSSGNFKPKEVRSRLVNRGMAPGGIVPFHYRPFDQAWLYWEGETNLLDRKRENLMEIAMRGIPVLICRQKAERGNEGTPFYISTSLIDWHLTRPGSIAFPNVVLLGHHRDLLTDHAPVKASSNLPNHILRNLGDLAPRDHELNVVARHILAIGHSPAYLVENADAVKQDWPRIPLPSDRHQLTISADLGRRVADLLDPASPVPGVNIGTVDKPLSPLLALVGQAKSLALDGALNHRLQARWGYRGQNNTCMPGPGDAQVRPWSPAELDAMAKTATAHGLDAATALALLGETCVDIHLNASTCWTAVPSSRLAAHDRRLSGDQEMAVLP